MLTVKVCSLQTPEYFTTYKDFAKKYQGCQCVKTFRNVSTVNKILRVGHSSLNNNAFS